MKIDLIDFVFLSRMRVHIFVSSLSKNPMTKTFISKRRRRKKPTLMLLMLRICRFLSLYAYVKCKRTEIEIIINNNVHDEEGQRSLVVIWENNRRYYAIESQSNAFIWFEYQITKSIV